MLPYSFSSDHCPTLFHYTSLESARAILASGSIWLTDHAAMNDSSEFDYAAGRFFALVREDRASLDPIVRLLLLEVVSSIRSGVGLFIGSLTARGDDLGQWRSYAEGGTGCALAIDARFLEHDAGVALRTVVYDEQTADAMIRASIAVVQQQFEETPDDAGIVIDYARRLAANLFAIKHPGFADEREVRATRMAVRDQAGDYVPTKGNRGEGVATPALPVFARPSAFGDTHSIALPLMRDHGSSAITGVTLGPTMQSELATAVAKEFEKMGLVVQRSALPFRR